MLGYALLEEKKDPLYGLGLYSGNSAAVTSSESREKESRWAVELQRLFIREIVNKTKQKTAGNSVLISYYE